MLALANVVHFLANEFSCLSAGRLSLLLNQPPFRCGTLLHPMTKEELDQPWLQYTDPLMSAIYTGVA